MQIYTWIYTRSFTWNIYTGGFIGVCDVLCTMMSTPCLVMWNL